MTIGEHLIVKRTGYTHHGLYAGNGQVIHYEGPDMGQPLGLVSKVSLSLFSDGEEIRVQDYPLRVYDAEESVVRAEKRMGEELYNLFLNNCEHFVVSCIMGVPFSKQVAASVIPLSICLAGLAASKPVKKALCQSLLKVGTGSSLIHGGLGAVAGGTSVGIFTGTTTTTTAGLLALPAAPILLPAVALVAGLGTVLAFGELDTVVDFAGDVVEGVSDFVGDVADTVFDAAEDVLDFLTGWV